MKPVRQLYLGLFLPYCVGRAFLLFPQHINSLRIPNFFSILAACLIGTLIAQFIRSRKDGATLVQLIPAIVILLVCTSRNTTTLVEWVNRIILALAHHLLQTCIVVCSNLCKTSI